MYVCAINIPQRGNVATVVFNLCWSRALTRKPARVLQQSNYINLCKYLLLPSGDTRIACNICVNKICKQSKKYVHMYIHTNLFYP